MNNSFCNNLFNQGLGDYNSYDGYTCAQQAYAAQQAYSRAEADHLAMQAAAIRRTQAALGAVDLVKHNGVWVLPEDVMIKEIEKGT